jgi:hypothetical protein
VGETGRLGITPKSWTVETRAAAHHGVLHLGKRWYVVSAEIDEQGHTHGVRLDGPYPDKAAAEAQAGRLGQAE